MKGEHLPRHGRRQTRFFRRKTGSDQGDELRAEHHSRQNDARAGTEDHCQRLTRQMFGAPTAVVLQNLRKHGDEGRRQRPFRKQLTTEIGNGIGHKKSVERAACAETGRRDDFAEKAENSAGEGTRHHGQGVAYHFSRFCVCHNPPASLPLSSPSLWLASPSQRTLRRIRFFVRRNAENGPSESRLSPNGSCLRDSTFAQRDRRRFPPTCPSP